MRTTIEIDDELMKEVMRISGAKTKRAAVEAALLSYVQINRQKGIRKLRGLVKWEGDLEQSRLSRFPDAEWNVSSEALERLNTLSRGAKTHRDHIDSFIP